MATFPDKEAATPKQRLDETEQKRPYQRPEISWEEKFLPLRAITGVGLTGAIGPTCGCF